MNNKAIIDLEEYLRLIEIREKYINKNIEGWGKYEQLEKEYQKIQDEKKKLEEQNNQLRAKLEFLQKSIRDVVKRYEFNLNIPKIEDRFYKDV
jgi:predicted  nucleic acid-binding Zn-ribbon protein